MATLINTSKEWQTASSEPNTDYRSLQSMSSQESKEIKHAETFDSLLNASRRRMRGGYRVQIRSFHPS